MSSAPITPCLWFDSDAEQAANFYVSLFPNARIKAVSRYSEAGHDIHGREPGSVMMVEFELGGRPFTALNGGPHFRFNEAVSFQVPCKDQAEIDRYWQALTADGGEEGQCGWLKDRYGLSWQIFPESLTKMLASEDKDAVMRVTNTFLKMKKFDLAALERAYSGETL